jgi:hypothetical protein
MTRMHTQTWSLALQLSAAGDHLTTITHSTYTPRGRQLPTSLHMAEAPRYADFRAALRLFEEACRRELEGEPALILRRH